jgi:hypothetical protein
MIQKLIAGLPNRTLTELQQQWMNAARYPGEEPHIVQFRKAVLSEWGKRARRASKPEDYFTWPSTNPKGEGGGDGISRNAQGLLKYMGYQVGMSNGESSPTRRNILDAVFAGELPPVIGPDYMRRWAKPGTPERLHRLANELATFARNAKSKGSANLEVAISDWEEDLDYLHDAYYVRKFHFGWPSY